MSLRSLTGWSPTRTILSPGFRPALAAAGIRHHRLDHGPFAEGHAQGSTLSFPFFSAFCSFLAAGVAAASSRD